VLMQNKSVQGKIEDRLLMAGHKKDQKRELFLASQIEEQRPKKAPIKNVKSKVMETKLSPCQKHSPVVE